MSKNIIDAWIKFWEKPLLENIPEMFPDPEATIIRGEPTFIDFIKQLIATAAKREQNHRRDETPWLSSRNLILRTLEHILLATESDTDQDIYLSKWFQLVPEFHDGNDDQVQLLSLTIRAHYHSKQYPHVKSVLQKIIEKYPQRISQVNWISIFNWAVGTDGGQPSPEILKILNDQNVQIPPKSVDSVFELYVRNIMNAGLLEENQLQCWQLACDTIFAQKPSENCIGGVLELLLSERDKIKNSLALNLYIIEAICKNTPSKRDDAFILAAEGLDFELFNQLLEKGPSVDAIGKAYVHALEHHDEQRCSRQIADTLFSRISDTVKSTVAQSVFENKFFSNKSYDKRSEVFRSHIKIDNMDIVIDSYDGNDPDKWQNKVKSVLSFGNILARNQDMTIFCEIVSQIQMLQKEKSGFFSNTSRKQAKIDVLTALLFSALTSKCKDDFISAWDKYKTDHATIYKQALQGHFSKRTANILGEVDRACQTDNAQPTAGDSKRNTK